MTAPNIATAQNVYGHSTPLAVTASAVAIVTGESGHLKKVIGLIVSNVGTGATADITVDLYRSSTAYRVACQVTVPPKTTLPLLGKDLPLFVEEADTLRVTASVTSTLEAVAVWEDVY
jgi:hypothetical protein